MFVVKLSVRTFLRFLWDKLALVRHKCYLKMTMFVRVTPLTVCTRNGQCYAFGDNTYGQLGIPGITSSYEPVRSQELESFHISYIACGSNHSAALSG